MDYATEYTDDLIGKVLAGEATESETAELASWRAANVQNEKYFAQMKTVFEKAASPLVEVQFDEDAAWKKVKQKLRPEAKVVVMKHKNSSAWMPLGVAAGVLIVLSLSYAAYTFLAPAIQTQEVVASITTVQDTLPDGSTAFLNKKSKISFVYNPRKKTRSVRLAGEAFFKVRHEEAKPFVIETENVLIRDIGTAFNVKAYPESNTVEVVVEEGEVQIYTLSNPGMRLTAGEKGIYDKTLKEFSRVEKADTNALSYKTKVFAFNNTDLRSVVALLNSVYDARISLSNDALNNCRLTVNFNNDKIDTIVDVLAETMGLTVVRKDSDIILEGAGCAY